MPNSKPIKQYTDAQLLRIAKRQKFIKILIVLTLLTIWIPFASIFMGIIAFPFIYRLGKALRSPGTWLFVVAAFIPFVDLISLLILNRIATVTLRRHQIRIGLTGARKEDLTRLAKLCTAS
jgi:hypothetical protein